MALSNRYWNCCVYGLLLFAGVGWTEQPSPESVDELGAKVILRNSPHPVIPYLMDWRPTDAGADQTTRGQGAPNGSTLTAKVTLRDLVVEYDAKRMRVPVYISSSLVSRPRLLDQAVQVEQGVDSLERIRRCCVRLGIPYINYGEIVLLGAFQR